MFDKLKSLFSKEAADEQAWQQRGQGRKLGAAEPQSSKPHAVHTGGAAAAGDGGLGLPAPSVLLKHRGNSLGGGGPSGPMPRSSSRPSDCQQQILEQVVMANTPTGRERSSLGAHLAPPQMLNNDSGSLGSSGGAMNTPTRGERNLGVGRSESHRLPPSEDFHLQRCLALVVSQGAATAADTLGALSRLIRNILVKPSEPKFRSVRLANPKVQATLMDVNGAMEFLEGVGFTLTFSDNNTSQQQQQPAGVGQAEILEGYLLLPDTAPLDPLVTGYHELTRAAAGAGLPPPEPLPAGAGGQQQQQEGASLPSSATPAAVSQAGSTAGGPQKLGGQQSGPLLREAGSAPVCNPTPEPVAAQVPVDRATQVVLPVAPDTQVPDEFFSRTGAELKGEWAAMAKRRAAGEVLMTRAWREKASGQATPQLTQATLRVRFSEGVCLQGNFGAGEPLSAVFEWLTEALRYPGELSYELIMPNRRPLPSYGRIRDHQTLMPSAVLNFRILGHAPTHMPMLSDEMLARTQIE